MSEALPAVLELPPEILEIAASLERAGYETWCVGGALRDRLLGFPGEDVDLATAATPDEVLRLFPHAVPVGVKYGTIGVLDRRRVLHEVTTFRRDVSTDGRHPTVAYGVSLEEDLARRDFTINALAYHPIRREWRDPFDGLGDLRAKRIRAVGDPARRFAEDYLRILRALRFAARFGFTIEAATWRAAIDAAPGLTQLSAERVREEWFRGLMTARDLASFVELWRSSGAAAARLPALSSGPGVRDPRPDRRDPVVLTVALCAGAAGVLARLKASGREVERARAMESGPAAPRGTDPVLVRRWMAAVGEAVDDLMLLARYREGTEPAWISVVEAIRSRGEATSRGQLAVTGDDLRDAGVPPGPEMGRLLARLLDLVLEEPSLNTRERLLAKAREWS